MTTLVGIRQAGFAVIVADSRSTAPFPGVDRGLARDDRQKVHVVGGWLLGFAGDDEVCDLWLESVRTVALRNGADPYVALSSIGRVREQVAAHRRCLPEHLVASAFMAFHDGSPRLLACDAAESVAWKPCDLVVNSPAMPGAFDLRIHLGHRPSPGRAVAAAAWLVGRTALVDPTVGGAVQAGLVDAAGARLLSVDCMTDVASRLADAQRAEMSGISEAAALVDRTASAGPA